MLPQRLCAWAGGHRAYIFNCNVRRISRGGERGPERDRAARGQQHRGLGTPVPRSVPRGGGDRSSLPFPRPRTALQIPRWAPGGAAGAGRGAGPGVPGVPGAPGAPGVPGVPGAPCSGSSAAATPIPRNPNSLRSPMVSVSRPGRRECCAAAVMRGAGKGGFVPLGLIWGGPGDAGGAGTEGRLYVRGLRCMLGTAR